MADETKSETNSYDLDKFIGQLTQCKPLNEKEVKFLIEKVKYFLN
jgi:hypothetical protein